MGKSLGIFVTTRNQMAHLLGLATAAKATGKKIDIFLTGEGVHLTQEATFPQLLETGRVGVCEVSFISFGYKKEAICGLTDKDFVTQARNAEIVDECDRYVTL